jgi:hypothetical protein
MSVQTYYCVPDDVGRILGFPSGTFTTTSTPSYNDVATLINTVEDEIDQRTGHAWRLKNAEHIEYYEMGRLGRRYSWYIWDGYPIFLRHRKVQPINTAQGDIFQVLMTSGNALTETAANTAHGVVLDTTSIWIDWTPYLGTRWYADWDNGIIKMWYQWLGYHAFTVRLLYRYGTVDNNLNPLPPNDVKRACAMRTASLLVLGSEKWNLLPEGANNIIAARDKMDFYQQYFDDVCDRYQEFSSPH